MDGSTLGGNMELKITIEEFKLIMKGLQELPAKESIMLILKLDQEYQKQDKKEEN